MLAPAAQLTGSAFGPLVVSLIVVGDDAGPAPFVSAAFALVALAGLAALALLQKPENAALVADSAGDK
jgi:hypothetical protein